MAEKKRGRPFKEETLESRNAAEHFRNRPEWSVLPPHPKQSELTGLIASMDIAEKEIIEQYKYSHTTSVKHAYAMASIGDEAMMNFEEALLEHDKVKRNESAKSKKSGGLAVKEIAASRATELCRINKILLQRLSPLGPRSMSYVARIILRDWHKLDPVSLLPGEPQTLRRRGLLGEPPTAKTIASYIKMASPYPQHRVGKTSLRNK